MDWHQLYFTLEFVGVCIRSITARRFGLLQSHNRFGPSFVGASPCMSRRLEQTCVWKLRTYSSRDAEIGSMVLVILATKKDHTRLSQASLPGWMRLRSVVSPPLFGAEGKALAGRPSTARGLA